MLASCISKTDERLIIMPQPADVLERFHKVLLRRITETRPDYLTAPFTVSEIYQDLVPYGSYRDLIGIEMNGDYEDALIRMLSGEGDYLLLDSEVARREIRKELASSNPNTALFRNFAAVDVRLHPSRVRLGTGAAAQAEAPDPPSFDLDEGSAESEVLLEASVNGPPWVSKLVDVRAAEPEPVIPQEAAPVDVVRAEPDGVDDDGVVGHIETIAASLVRSPAMPPPDESDTSAGNVDGLAACAWCREDLPQRASIHFCPFCGSDLRTTPCRKCGEAIEARWQFCASCGTDIRD